MRAWRAAMVMRAAIMAIAPAMTIGNMSQKSPRRPPARAIPAMAAPVPTAPMPVRARRVSEIEKLAIGLTVPLAIAIFWISVNTLRNDAPKILLTSTARAQAIKLRLIAIAVMIMRGNMRLTL